MNLASRKKFWLKRSQIENQMKAKVYEDGGDGVQYDYDELRVDDSMIEEMKVGKHEIERMNQMTRNNHGMIQIERSKSLTRTVQWIKKRTTTI